MVPVASFVGNQLTVTGLTNPTTSAYTPFLFILHSTAQVIGYSEPSTPSTHTYAFSLQCTLPCRTCSGTTTSCTSCYSGLDWLPYPLLNAQSNTCVGGCAEGEYLSGSSCLACDSNCSLCVMYGAGGTDGNATHCVGCASG